MYRISKGKKYITTGSRTYEFHMTPDFAGTEYHLTARRQVSYPQTTGSTFVTDMSFFTLP